MTFVGRSAVRTWSQLAVCVGVGAGAMALGSVQAQELTGAGSSFAAPLYAAVSDQLGPKNKFSFTYASVGSSEGIKRIAEKSVDFGASDKPLSRKELADRGLLQFPTAIGGLVVTANLPGVPVGQLKLDAAALGDVYLGKITRWDDPRLAALNPGTKLPPLAIKPVVRESGSGSTYLFSNYLSRAYPHWHETIGVTTALTMAGTVVAKGNSGVAQAVLATPGALGYAEFGFMKGKNLPFVQLKNKYGTFVSANPESISAAVRGADWELMFIDTDPIFDVNTTDIACPGCWPMVGLTYVVVPRRWVDADKAGVFTRFLETLLTDGDPIAQQEHYVPLPSKAKSLVRVSLRSQLQDKKGQRPKAQQNDADDATTRLMALALP